MLARLYIEPPYTELRITQYLGDRRGPSLSRFLLTRFRVSSRLDSSNEPKEHVPEPQPRVRRLSDGLVQRELGDPRLNFDRFLPTWFFAPSNGQRATYKAPGARSDPAYHR